MSRAVLFSVFLKKAMEVRGLDVLSLAKEMGYRTLGPVTRWCEGRQASPVVRTAPARLGAGRRPHHRLRRLADG
jgi:hypothetical protein